MERAAGASRVLSGSRFEVTRQGEERAVQRDWETKAVNTSTTFPNINLHKLTPFVDA